ncbi:hypothetical protein O1L60_00850 [Streptomyces diastatochromogenes]|nr:hypothetical protein [Streptomyces diastatochromogenes]
MADTVDSLATRFHDLLVALLTQGPATVGTAGLHDVVARATALGPDGAWLAAAGHAGLGGLACAHGQTDQAVLHFDAAVSAGYNDCVALHVAPVRPLHGDPRFQDLYRRMRVTQGDLDEMFWLHQEMQIMSREAQEMAVDNVGRLDTGVSVLPRPPCRPARRTPRCAGHPPRSRRDRGRAPADRPEGGVPAQRRQHRSRSHRRHLGPPPRQVRRPVRRRVGRPAPAGGRGPCFRRTSRRRRHARPCPPLGSITYPA